MWTNFTEVPIFEKFQGKVFVFITIIFKLNLSIIKCPLGFCRLKIVFLIVFSYLIINYLFFLTKKSFNTIIITDFSLLFFLSKKIF